jgi:hypothetical protein
MENNDLEGVGNGEDHDENFNDTTGFAGEAAGRIALTADFERRAHAHCASVREK